MGLVSFPLKKDGFRIVYPDGMENFRNARIEGDQVVAEYFGRQKLTAYTPAAQPEPPAPPEQGVTGQLDKIAAELAVLREMLETKNAR